MLYQLYRYLIGLSALSVMAVTLYMCVFFTNPYMFSSTGLNQTFAPLMTMTNLFSMILATISVLFIHPFVTDGDETLSMETPISHASIQGNIILIASMAMIQICARDSGLTYYEQQAIIATAFVLKIALISIMTTVVAFYTIRHRSIVTAKRGERCRAFCFKSTFWSF